MYEQLREYIDGEKLIPRDVTQLVKHHNCYAAYVLDKTVKRIECARLYGPSGSEDTDTDSGHTAGEQGHQHQPPINHCASSAKKLRH